MVSNVSSRPYDDEDLKIYTPPPIEKEKEEEAQQKELEKSSQAAAGSRDKQDRDITMPGTNPADRVQAKEKAESKEGSKTKDSSKNLGSETKVTTGGKETKPGEDSTASTEAAKPQTTEPRNTTLHQVIGDSETDQKSNFDTAIKQANTAQEVQAAMTANPEMAEAVMSKVLTDGLGQVRTNLKKEQGFEADRNYSQLSKAYTDFFRNLGNLDPNKFQDPGLRAAAAMMSTSPELKQNAEALGSLFAGMQNDILRDRAIEKFPELATKLRTGNREEQIQAVSEMLKLAQDSVGGGMLSKTAVFEDIISSALNPPSQEDLNKLRSEITDLKRSNSDQDTLKGKEEELKSKEQELRQKKQIASLGAELATKLDPEKIPEIANFALKLADELKSNDRLKTQLADAMNSGDFKKLAESTELKNLYSSLSKDAQEHLKNLVLDKVSSLALDQGIDLTGRDIKGTLAQLLDSKGNLDVDKKSEEITNLITQSIRDWSKLNQQDKDTVKDLISKTLYDNKGNINLGNIVKGWDKLSEERKAEITRDIKANLSKISDRSDLKRTDSFEEDFRTMVQISAYLDLKTQGDFMGSQEHRMSLIKNFPSPFDSKDLPKYSDALKEQQKFNDMPSWHAIYDSKLSTTRTQDGMNDSINRGLTLGVHNSVEKQLEKAKKQVEGLGRAFRDESTGSPTVTLYGLDKLSQLQELEQSLKQKLGTVDKPEVTTEDIDRTLAAITSPPTKQTQEITQQVKDQIQDLVLQSMAKGLGELKAKLENYDPAKQREVIEQFLKNPQSVVEEGYFGEDSGKNYSLEQMLSTARTRELEILNGNKPIPDETAGLAALVQAIPQENYNADRIAKFLSLADKSREEKVDPAITVREVDHTAEMYKEYFSILNDSLEGLNTTESAQTIASVLGNAKESNADQSSIEAVSTALAHMDAESREKVLDGLARAAIHADWANDKNSLNHMDSKLATDLISGLKENPEAVKAAVEKIYENSNTKIDTDKLSKLINTALKVVDDPQKLSELAMPLIKDLVSGEPINTVDLTLDPAFPKVVSEYLAQVGNNINEAKDLAHAAIDMVGLLSDGSLGITQQEHEALAKVLGAGISTLDEANREKLAQQITEIAKSMANSDGAPIDPQEYIYEIAGAMETLTSGLEKPEHREHALETILSLSHGSLNGGPETDAKATIDPQQIKTVAKVLSRLHDGTNADFENALTDLSRTYGNAELSPEQRDLESLAILTSALNQNRARLTATDPEQAAKLKEKDQELIAELIKPELRSQLGYGAEASPEEKQAQEEQIDKMSKAVAGLLTNLDSAESTKEVLSKLQDLSKIAQPIQEDPSKVTFGAMKELLDASKEFIEAYDKGTLKASTEERAEALKTVIDSMGVSLGEMDISPEQAIASFRENPSQYNNLLDSTAAFLGNDTAKALIRSIAADQDLPQSAQTVMNNILKNPDILKDLKLNDKELDAIDTLLDAQEKILGADGKLSADDILALAASAYANPETRSEVFNNVYNTIVPRISSQVRSQAYGQAAAGAAAGAREWRNSHGPIMNWLAGGKPEAIARNIAYGVANTLIPKSIGQTTANLKPYFDEIGFIGMISSPEFQSQLEKMPGMDTSVLESTMTQDEAIKYLESQLDTSKPMSNEDYAKTAQALYALGREGLDKFLNAETGRYSFGRGYGPKGSRAQAGYFSDRAKAFLDKTANQLREKIYADRGVDIKKLEAETKKAMETLATYTASAMKTLGIDRAGVEKIAAYAQSKTEKPISPEETAAKEKDRAIQEKLKSGETFAVKIDLENARNYISRDFISDEKLAELANNNNLYAIQNKNQWGEQVLAYQSKTPTGNPDNDTGLFIKGKQSEYKADKVASTFIDALPGVDEKYGHLIGQLGEVGTQQNPMLTQFLDRAAAADPSNRETPGEISPETLEALKAGNNRFDLNRPSNSPVQKDLPAETQPAQKEKTTLEYLTQRDNSGLSAYEKLAGQKVDKEEDLEKKAQEYLEKNPSVRIYEKDGETYFAFKASNGNIAVRSIDKLKEEGAGFWANQEHKDIYSKLTGDSKLSSNDSNSSGYTQSKADVIAQKYQRTYSNQNSYSRSSGSSSRRRSHSGIIKPGNRMSWRGR